MKKFITIFILFCIFFINQNWVYASNDFSAEVKISLWKKHEDLPSMGTTAFSNFGKIIKKDENYYIAVKIFPIEFMNQKGYLGEIKTDKGEVKVLSEYDIFDEYNNIENGKDEHIKGKKYPKEILLPFNKDEKIINLSMYIPIMAEMGFGTQDARLIIDECQPVEKTVKEEDKESKNETKNIEVGLYKLPVKLIHAVEDKESMGNLALNQVGEIFVVNNEINLFIESKIMKLQNIEASLANIYFLKSDKYYPAEKGDFTLELPKTLDKRNKVFKIPLETIREDTLNLLVDPKVAPMGDEPIKARLKIDFSKIEKIAEDENSLKNRFFEREGKEKFDYSLAGSCSNKGILINYRENSFDDNFEFFANKIKDSELENYDSLFGPLDTNEIYKLEFLKPLDFIEKDFTSFQDSREKISPKEKLEIKIPIGNIEEAGKSTIYKVENNEKVEVAFETEDNFYKFYGTNGIYVVNKDNKTSLVNTQKQVPVTLKKYKSNAKNVKVVRSVDVEKPTSNIETNNLQTQVIEDRTIYDNQDKFLENLKSLKNDIRKVRENKVIIFFGISLIMLTNVICGIILKKNLGDLIEVIVENKNLKKGKL